MFVFQCVTCTRFEKNVCIPNRNIFPVRKTRPYSQPKHIPGSNNMTVFRCMACNTCRDATAYAPQTPPVGGENTSVSLTETYSPFEKHGRIPNRNMYPVRKTYSYFDVRHVTRVGAYCIRLTNATRRWRKHVRIPNHHPTKPPITRPSFGPVVPSVGRMQYAPTTGDTPWLG